MDIWLATGGFALVIGVVVWGITSIANDRMMLNTLIERLAGREPSPWPRRINAFSATLAVLLIFTGIIDLLIAVVIGLVQLIN